MNYKLYACFILSFGVFYTYVSFILASTIEKDICTLKKFNNYCLIGSQTKKDCLNVMLNQNICDKYEEGEIDCFQKLLYNINVCKVYLSRFEYFEDLGYNSIINPNA